DSGAIAICDTIGGAARGTGCWTDEGIGSTTGARAMVPIPDEASKPAAGGGTNADGARPGSGNGEAAGVSYAGSTRGRSSIASGPSGPGAGSGDGSPGYSVDP